MKLFKNEYYIKQVDYNTAMDVVIKNHYMHRKCPCSKAFGLYNKYNELVGIVTYGVPPSSTLLKGICGEEEKNNIYELNRLWIYDEIPNNAESFLIGNTIKLLDKEIIVSYSDTSVGHVGYIYQACNFLYTGLSSKFKDPRVKGMEGMHHATFAKGLSNKQVIEKYGKENVYFVDRPRKHRYVYINAKNKRKKELLSKLKYKILPYPKGDSMRHEKNEKYGY